MLDRIEMLEPIFELISSRQSSRPPTPTGREELEARGLVGLLGGPENDPRAFRRWAVHGTADIVTPDGRVIEAELLDLGAGGCRIEVAEQLPRGTVVTPCFVHAERGLRYEIPAVVVWVEGRRTAGLRFVGKAERRRVLSSGFPSEEPERRDWDEGPTGRFRIARRRAPRPELIDREGGASSEAATIRLFDPVAVVARQSDAPLDAR
jgi:hypothetical protein